MRYAGGVEVWVFFIFVGSKCVDSFVCGERESHGNPRVMICIIILTCTWLILICMDIEMVNDKSRAKQL